jgi:hypothetical protein
MLSVIVKLIANRTSGHPTLTRQRELLILCARIGFNP